MTAKPWDNPNLRRALAAAVDRKAILDEVFKGSATALASMVPSVFPTSQPKWEEFYGAGAPPPTTRQGARLPPPARRSSTATSRPPG